MSEKTRRDELAVFGGPPAFGEGDALHVGRPNIGDRARFLERVSGIFDRRRLTNDGPLVRELERRLADALDVPHCVAVASGTVGLQVAARALGLEGEVIMPSLTFVATAHALEWLGIRPVFKTASGKALFKAYAIPKLAELEKDQVRLMTVRSEGQFNTVVY